jgi:RodZ C-terminal domain
VLIGALIGVVIVVAVIVAVVLRSRSHDDEHSVDHYHRQLHTLEEIQAHPLEPENGNGSASTYPASAFRVSGSSTVRLTEPGRAIVPPVPPPLPNPGRPITFGDDHADEAGVEDGENPEKVDESEKAAGTFMSGTEDRAMHGINHRPRRLAGPAAAVAGVLVLIAVLIVTGVHANSPHKGKAPTTATTTHNHPRTSTRHQSTTTTSTTAAPAVSAPQAPTANSASYQVAGSSYSLALSASGGDCWVEATNTTNGSVLFTATLFSGQSHTIAASGPVTVIAGAPGAFAATVNGATVVLPPGNQAPFTLHFQAATTSA